MISNLACCHIVIYIANMGTQVLYLKYLGIHLPIASDVVLKKCIGTRLNHCTK